MLEDERTIQYTYDALARLTEADHGHTQYTYGFDLAGNLVNLNGVSRTYDTANRLVHDGTQALTYDANGNLTNDGTSSYTWDRANRLLSMGGHSYAYDGDGRRISQTVSSVVTKYLLDIQPDLSVVLSQTVDDTDTTHYVHGPQGLHAVQSPAGEWMHPVTDGLGSVRGYLDIHGTVLSSVHYGEWGVPSAGIVGPAFTGEWRDANALQHHRARYLKPDLATWLSLDPWEGLHERPMSLNGYSWVEGNPVNLTDASGEAVPAALVAIAVAVVAVLPLAIAGQQLVKNSLCVLFSDLPTCRDPFNNPTTILESICVPAIQAVMSVAQPQAIPAPQAPPYGDDFPSLDDLTNPTMSLLLLWLLMQQLTRVQPNIRDRVEEKSCDPEVFAEWWLTLPDYVGPVGNLQAALWENIVARNSIDTFPGLVPKRVDLPGAQDLGLRWNTLDADGATRDTCRLVDAKYATTNFYNPTNRPFLLRSSQPEIILLKRYRYALDITPAVGVEIRINRFDNEAYWIAALEVAGFTYNKDGFVFVYPGADLPQ